MIRQAVGSGHSGGHPGKSLAGKAKEIMAEPEGCSSTFTFFFFFETDTPPPETLKFWNTFHCPPFYQKMT